MRTKGLNMYKKPRPYEGLARYVIIFMSGTLNFIWLDIKHLFMHTGPPTYSVLHEQREQAENGHVQKIADAPFIVKECLHLGDPPLRKTFSSSSN